VWLLEQGGSVPYVPALATLAAVLALQLLVDRRGGDDGDAERAREADGYLMLDALLAHARGLVFGGSGGDSGSDDGAGEDVFAAREPSGCDAVLIACASTLAATDPALFDHLEQALRLPIIAAADPASPSPAAPSLVRAASSGSDDLTAAVALGGSSLLGGGDDEDDGDDGGGQGSRVDPGWAVAWVGTLLARQAGGGSGGLFALWDAILDGVGDATQAAQGSSAKGAAGGAIVPESWATTLAPLVVAALVGHREALLACGTRSAAGRSGLLAPGAPMLHPVAAGLARGLRIRRPESLEEEDPSVRVVAFQTGPLGLVLGKREGNGAALGLHVRKFQVDEAKGGAAMQAEASGRIAVGDALVAVNGIPVPSDLTPQRLVQLLGRVGRPVKVAFRRPAAATAAAAAAAAASNASAVPPPFELRAPIARRPPSPPFSAAASSSSAVAVARDRVSSDGQLGGQGESYASAVSSGAATLFESMDPEVYAAASAAGRHLSSLAAAGLGAAGIDSSVVGDVRDTLGGVMGGGVGGGNEKRSDSPVLGCGDDGAFDGGAALGRAPFTKAEDGFVLPRVAGEEYIAEIKVQMEAWHRARLGDGGLNRVWVPGQLSVSNFRLHFHALHKQRWPDWQAPVHACEKFDSSKSSDGNGAGGGQRYARTIGISCKDGQFRKFVATRPAEEGHILDDEFHELQRAFYAWAFCPEDRFARVHAKAVEAERVAIAAATGGGGGGGGGGEAAGGECGAGGGVDGALDREALAVMAEAAAASGAEDFKADPEALAKHRLAAAEARRVLACLPSPLLPESLGGVTLQGEFDRLGLASYSKLRLVRQDVLNLCITYPLELLFPSSVSNKELQAVAKYRSKNRLPVVTWFDVRTGASIARCAQPLVGMNSKRCVEDEKMVQALAALTYREVMNKDGDLEPGHFAYYIVDARSKVATRGNQLMGKGVEQVKYYRDSRHTAELQFMNIGNIHAVRESFETLHGLARPAALEGSASAAGWLGKVDATGWLGHVLAIVKASNFIVEAVTREKCGVLVHCSDGWDRTPQLCALAQLCIDPYYRTLRGFAALVEKEWLAYGHKFSERCAHGAMQPTEEKSQVFPLWLDCVWQLSRQFPTILQFNESFLLALLDQLYSCRFGSFLSNSFIERNKHHGETLAVWSWVEARAGDYLNPHYERYTEGPVLPSTNPKNIVLWEGYFQRFDVSVLPFNPKAHDPPTYYD